MENESNLNNFLLPKMYSDFLHSIEGKLYYVKDTGIILYTTKEINERNTTYEVKKYSPDSLMVGQDGDMGFFLKRNQGESIFSLDLGALGSLDMDEEAEDIYSFIGLVAQPKKTSIV